MPRVSRYAKVKRKEFRGIELRTLVHKAYSDPVMQDPINSSANPVATNVAVSVGPAAVGVAAGLLLADALDSRARRITALSLLGVGFVSAVPYLTSLVLQRVNGPKSRRGSNKTIASIRDGGGVYEEEDYQFD